MGNRYDHAAAAALRCAAMQDCARAHAQAEAEEGTPCACLDGWRLSPWDTWQRCPACQTGPHPEERIYHENLADDWERDQVEAEEADKDKDGDRPW